MQHVFEVNDAAAPFSAAESLELWRQLLGVAIDSKYLLGTESRKKNQEMLEKISNCHS